MPEVEQLNGLLEPTGKVFPGIDDLIHFSQWSPRLGATVKLDNEGETVLKSHWGRYYGKLISNHFHRFSPGNTNLTAFEYNPATGATTSRCLQHQPEGELRDRSRPDAAVHRPVLHRARAPAAAKLRRHRVVRGEEGARLHPPQGRRRHLRASQIVDTFQGRSQNLTVYNLTSPSLQSVFEVTNRDDLDQDYKAVVVEANKRFSRSWQMMTLYTGQRNLIYNRGNMATQGFGNLNRNGFGRDPNDLTNAYGPSCGRRFAVAEGDDDLPGAVRHPRRRPLLLRHRPAVQAGWSACR